ncbi:MAG: hypothetical protein H7835_02275 [Magnetococcus sp. XQGC-1]
MLRWVAWASAGRVCPAAWLLSSSPPPLLSPLRTFITCNARHTLGDEAEGLCQLFWINHGVMSGWWEPDRGPTT